VANSGSRSDDSIGRRRPRSELRELILQAGYEVLLAEGLGLGTEGLTYKRVFEHLDRTRGIRVTRGSVHERIWDSQREFQLDVLARAARWDSTFSMARTADAIADVLAGVDLATTDARFQALKEAVRIGARVNLEASESDNLWEIWEGVAAIISIQRELDYGVDRVRNEIAASYEETTEMLIAFFDTMIETLGLAVRPSLGLTHDDAVRKFAMISNALSQGSSLRRRHEAEYRGEFMLPTGPDREMEVWDLFSLGLWALSLFFFENGGSPINRADPDE
jgi:hypothetical protein